MKDDVYLPENTDELKIYFKIYEVRDRLFTTLTYT